MTADGEALALPAASARHAQGAAGADRSPRPTGSRACTAASHMDYVGVKRFDAAGQLTGELRIVGLFTSTAYTRSTRGIPYLRRKVAAVIARAGFDAASHSGKALAVVLEQYPRDELFQIDDETLLRFALMILQLDERPRVRVLARRDRFDRFVSVAGLRAARPLRQRDPRRDRRPAWPTPIAASAAAFYAVLPRRPAGARALHHRARDGNRWRTRSAPSSKAASPTSCAPGATSSPTRSPRRTTGAGARAARALPGRLLAGLSRGVLRRSTRSATSA